MLLTFQTFSLTSRLFLLIIPGDKYTTIIIGAFPMLMYSSIFTQ